MLTTAITRYPSDHELLSAQRVDFHLMNVLKLYHPAMVQSSKSSASDAMVDFFEQDPENPTLPLYYDLADRYTFLHKKGRCSRCPSHLRARPCYAFIFYCAVMYALSFNYDSCSLSAADAECCQTSLGIPLLHLVDQ